MVDATQKTIAIFGGGRAQNDANRSLILTQAGTFFAKKNAKLVCMQGEGGLPMVALGAARAAGGDIEIIVADDFEIPKALGEVKITRENDIAMRYKLTSQKVQAIVALPGGLSLANDLFQISMNQTTACPTILLNHENAFEVLRGFFADVLVHDHPNAEGAMQVADSLDDVWNRVTRLS